MTERYRKFLAAAGIGAALTVAALPVAQAKQGADDPVNHDAGDDNGGLVVKAPGADDPANHDVNDDRRTTVRKREARHHHRRHHGRHHARDARHGHGKDDPAGHDRNDDRGGDR
jgi:hypothetical protein